MRISDLSAALGKVFGGVCALALTSAAHAVVVVSPAANVAIPVTTSGVYINVVSGVSGTTPASSPGWDINPWGSGSLFVYAGTGGGMVLTGAAVASLPIGSVVGPAATYGASPGAGAWTLNATNYFGFSFLGDDTLLHYGYASVIVGASATDPVRKIGNVWYESAANTAITVAVPEPSTWAMMMGGLAVAGAVARRQRRTQA